MARWNQCWYLWLSRHGLDFPLQPYLLLCPRPCPEFQPNLPSSDPRNVSVFDCFCALPGSVSSGWNSSCPSAHPQSFPNPVPCCLHYKILSFSFWLPKEEIHHKNIHTHQENIKPKFPPHRSSCHRYKEWQPGITLVPGMRVWLAWWAFKALWYFHLYKWIRPLQTLKSPGT